MHLHKIKRCNKYNGKSWNKNDIYITERVLVIAIDCFFDFTYELSDKDFFLFIISEVIPMSDYDHSYKSHIKI